MSLFDQIWIIGYRIFFSPLAHLVIVLISPFVPKVREGLRLRQKGHAHGKLKANTPLIWLHCASGEFEYAKSVIREIKNKNPQINIYVSYFSPTYRKNIESSADVDMSEPLPLDLPGPIHSRLELIKPQLILISRTDIWPEFVYQAKLSQIPVVLFSATRPQPSKLRAYLATIFFRHWTWLKEIYVVSPEDAKHIKMCWPNLNPQVLGDTRYDQVRYRLKNPKTLKDQLRPSEPTAVLAAGSTWPEDEKIILPAAADFIKNHQLRLLIAPHEVNESHLRSIEQFFLRNDIPTIRYSQAQEWALGNVLVLDQMGILADIYCWGSFAFVGGSFRGSVHSVMEPLSHGLITLVGPYTANNREAQDFSKIKVTQQHNAVQHCQNMDQLKECIRILISQKRDPEVSQKITREIENRSGTSVKLLNHLSNAMLSL